MTYWIVGAIALALILLGIMVYQVLKELRPTVKAAQKAALTMQKAAEQSQEIVYRMQSISENLAHQGEQIQIIRAYATETVYQVREAATLVKPALFAYESAKVLYQNYKNGTSKSWLAKLVS